VAGFLEARAAADAVERLAAILRSFPVAVDLGARDGAFARALAGSDAAARAGLLIETDLSAAIVNGRAGLEVQGHCGQVRLLPCPPHVPPRLPSAIEND
jgi:hypothetical protein